MEKYRRTDITINNNLQGNKETTLNVLVSHLGSKYCGDSEMDNEELRIAPGEDEQRSNWRVMESYLDSCLKEINLSNFEKVLKDIYEVNVILARDIVVRLIIKYQTMNDQANLYAGLAAALNLIVPEIGGVLTRESTAYFIVAYNKLDDVQAFAMVSLLAQLFNYEVTHEIVILQIIHLLSEDLNESSVHIIIHLLRQCGKHLSEVSSTAHNMIFEKLREVLQEGKLSKTANHYLEELFDLRRLDYKASSFKSLLKDKDMEHTTHTFMVDPEASRPNADLGHFVYHKDFMEIERKYYDLKQKIELSEVENAEPVPTVAKDMTGKNDVEFKKQFYLILKSSLSSDEAAHKILRLRIPDADKHKVVNVIVKSSIQEPTYSKFYGLLAERLCSSHKTWKPAFEQTFRANYDEIEELEPAQLRTLGRFWGHVLASDFIGFEVFENVHMSEDGTSASGRIFLKFIFQEVVAALGINELKERFKEDYIQPFLINLFPKEDPENIRYSINYFTAIGLGVLTEDMRKQLDLIQAKEQETEIAKKRENRPRANSRYRPHERASRRARSITPPRRQRKKSVTPPRRRARSRSPIARRR